MEIIDLVVEVRNEVGSNKLGKLRRDGFIPAVLYAKGTEPTALKVNRKDFLKAAHGVSTNLLLNLKIDGKNSTALVKSAQRSIMKRDILHLDFQGVSLEERVMAVVPLNLVGEPVGSKSGGVMQHMVWEIEVRVAVKDMPEYLQHDISSLEVGTSLKVGDLNFGDDIEILSDPETVIAAIISATKSAAAADAAEAEVAAAAAATAEPALVGAEAAKE